MKTPAPPPIEQSCFVDDYDCTDPGQTHVIRDGWKGYTRNDPHYCVRCIRHLWFNDERRTWFARKRTYRIDEEPG